MEMDEIDIDIPENTNIILGYSHFIKTVEDLNEIIKTTVPQSSYAIVFSEASGERLIRYEGNDEFLINLGIENIRKISAGHTFLIYLKNAYPINVLNAIKLCQEVGTIYAATANPLKVIIARTDNGNAVLGVSDGYSPLGVEDEAAKKKRHKLLRDIGYKS
ncbi:MULTISPECIES: adenosine-specific kinase [Acidiplasma]|jgi:adenosine/AMP kinase|nr:MULTISPECIES: adenosine-specific kinase [Acidiplasma]WMT55192.1 MAG: adenosine-specific kinase [Acidiplasma sp.]